MLWWVLGLNVAVAVTKLTYGTLVNSVAVTADGFHSLFDGASNVIALLGTGLAARPADRDHPYGHTKYETFASAAIGALLLLAAWRVGSEAIGRLLHPDAGPSVDAISFVVMGVTLVVNILVTAGERRAGERLGSGLLRADAAHTGSDVLVTLGVIGGLAAVRLGVPLADPVIGLTVAGFIVFAGFRVLRGAGATLADSARIAPDAIVEVCLRVHGVLGCHEVRTRGSADEVSVDLHVQVDPRISVIEGHAIIERVERAVADAFTQVVDVIAHLEPFDDYQRHKTAVQEERGML